MDPHSSYSQFNQRTTKAGPIPLSRFVEPTPKTPIGSLPKRPMKSSASSSAPRLIATNSRVKQDEKYRKDMFLAYVSNALQQKSNVHCIFSRLDRRADFLHSQGNNEPFNELVDQFNPKRPRGDGAPVTPQLRLWLLALSHMVSQLERQHAPLVDAIVNMPWFTMDTAFVNSYIDFTGMLLSARPEYLSLVLGKIAQGFTHRKPVFIALNRYDVS
jgi:RNA polymerase I-specific transcription initiation factor RRN3